MRSGPAAGEARSVDRERAARRQDLPERHQQEHTPEGRDPDRGLASEQRGPEGRFHGRGSTDA